MKHLVILIMLLGTTLAEARLAKAAKPHLLQDSRRPSAEWLDPDLMCEEITEAHAEGLQFANGIEVLGTDVCGE